MSTVLITGAGSGIGAALARCFRSDGWTVAGCDLEEPKDCEMTFACDVTDGDAMRAMVQTIGRVDALVANAGLGRRATIEDAAWIDIERVVEVNMFGVILSARAVLPVMRAQGFGRIVNVCSRNAEICPPGLVGYNVSKAGVAAFTRTLARELGDADILVNNLIPGPTATPMNPRGTRPPEQCYPTVKMLATLPAGGPSGRTFFDEQEYPLFARFSE